MTANSPRVKIDKVGSRDEAEAIWKERCLERGVIACCFVLMEESKIAPKAILPEVWHVHTVYHD